MPDDTNLLARISEDFKEAIVSGREDAYSRLSTTLEKMENELREYAQKLAMHEMKAVLLKLKNDEPLSDQDVAKLKSWIVGDAEYYIRREQNFENWSSDLQRLIGEMTELWVERPDVERLLKLRGLARDALDKAAAIAFYVKQKASVEKFNTATKQIGESERVVLVSLLEQKISSSRF